MIGASVGSYRLLRSTFVACLTAAIVGVASADAQETETSAAPTIDTAELSQRTRITAPSRERGAWVAKIVRSTMARPAPGSRRRGRWVSTTVPGGYFPQELLVLAARNDERDRLWLQVRLPQRPNTAKGWIPADAARMRHTDTWVAVSTGKRVVRVYRKRQLRMEIRGVVGAASTPTPHGLFAVMLISRQRDPRGLIGPWAIHLTAHSNVLENYGGGPGRVALHGRGGAYLNDPLGSARSHGCVRVDNDRISLLAQILRPGTPVQVTV